MLLLHNCLLLAVVSVAGVGEGGVQYSALYQVQISNACYQIMLCTNVLSTGLNVSSLVSNDCCLYLETICGSSHILYQNLGQMLMVYKSFMYFKRTKHAIFYFLLSHKRANECVNLLPLFLGR